MVVSGIGQELAKEFILKGEEMVDSTFANYFYLKSGSII